MNRDRRLGIVSTQVYYYYSRCNVYYSKTQNNIAKTRLATKHQRIEMRGKVKFPGVVIDSRRLFLEHLLRESYPSFSQAIDFGK